MLGEIYGYPFHLALAGCAAGIVLVFGTKKLKNIGSDLGGAIKGFKDGMKDGNTSTSDATQAASASQVAAEKNTIDVEAKQKG